MSKHIIFISEENEFQNNENFIKNKLLSKFNQNIYDHVLMNDFHNDKSNLIIIMGNKLLNNNFLNRSFNKFFNDEERGQYFYSIENYSEFKFIDKKEENNKIKEIKEKINKFLKRFALIRVTDKSFFYRDIDFKKIKEKNQSEAYFKYVEDENGEYESYNGKKLKRILKNVLTIKETYDEHLRVKDIFYYENYPNIAHTKLLHYITYDIENNHSLDVINAPEPIISIVAYSNIYNKNFIWVLKKRSNQIINKEEFKNDKLFIFEDEKKMLNHFWSALVKLEVDLMAAFNGDFFDVPYLINRSKNLNVDYTKFIGYAYNRRGKDGNHSLMSNDIILWDYERYAKWVMSENKPPSWSLNAVSKHLFNEEKIKHDGTNILWDKDDLTELIKYNIHDVYLTEKINKNQKLIEFPMLYQVIAPQQFEDVYFNSIFLENLIHQKFNKFKFPTKQRIKNEESFKGGLVLPTNPGRYTNVSLYDFKGTYPSIMISLNLSKDTIVENGEYDSTINIKIDDVVFQTNKKGILPQLSEILLNERNKINKKKMQYDGNSPEFKILNDLEMTFKKTSNALWGVSGYTGFILYDKRVAKSITYVARELLTTLTNIVISKGYNILYGDTDSLAIEILADSFEESIKKSIELENEFNKIIPDFVRRFTNNEKTISSNIIKVLFEKSYSKLLLCKAKKRQVGFVKYFKGKIFEEEELIVKGFESIKDDTPLYFKDKLDKLYRNILNNYNDVEKLKEFVNDVKSNLKNQSIENLIIRKRLSKRMEDFDSNPIHVKALKNSNVILRQGETVNMLFVQDDREVIHYEEGMKIDFKIDYQRYFNNFFIRKLELIDENLHYKLFLERTKLINISKDNLIKRIRLNNKKLIWKYLINMK